MDSELNAIQLEGNCRNALKTCNFAGVTGENCASEFCNGFPATTGTCVQYGFDTDNCCESSDPASCLANYVQNGVGGAAATPNVCASVVSIIASCSSATPAAFTDGSFSVVGPLATSLASCACYDSSGSYDPDTLDGFASNCVASGEAAHPTYYPYGSILNGFCTNILAPAGAAASTTPPSAQSSVVLSVSVTDTAAGPVQASVTPASTPNTTPASTTSGQDTQITSSPAGTTSSKTSTSANVGSSQSASTTTASSSSGFKKATLQKGSVLLLGLSVVFSAL